MIGFFIMGLMHLKITLSYQYCAELMENNHKQISLTFISMFDTAQIGVCCFYLLYIDTNLIKYLKGMFCIGTVAFVLFLVLIPESPRYLFMKNPMSKEAIRVLNYIAWFNGSSKRVPEDSIMDNIHQVIKDNNQLNISK
jgi:high-affinity Fe2+/Pb2+ permease